MDVSVTTMRLPKPVWGVCGGGGGGGGGGVGSGNDGCLACLEERESVASPRFLTCLRFPFPPGKQERLLLAP